MKVLVVGAGGMGSAICYHLAKSGAEVIAFDRHVPGHDQGSSHGETRLIRQAYFESPDYVPLLKRAYELWDDLGREWGQPLLHRTGLLIAGPASSALLTDVDASAREHSIPVKRLDTEACRQRLQWSQIPQGFEGVWEGGGGYLLVEDCVRAHHRGALERGARFVEGEVQEWGEGETGVWAKCDGKRWEADALVLSQGAWMQEWLRSELGVRLTIHENALFWVKGEGPAPSTCFAFELEDGFFYGFPEIDGRWKVAHHAPGPEIRANRTFVPSDTCRQRIQRFLSHIYGSPYQIEREATCLYTMSPDEHFIIDQHPEFPRVFLAGGFSGHGFKFASVVGEEIAQGVLGGEIPPGLKFLGLPRLWS